jgi:serine/threonine protein kinase
MPQMADERHCKMNSTATIVAELALGGMATEYRAFDNKLGRHVVLKILRESDDPTASPMFRREFAALAMMSHPNIVEIYAVGEAVDPSGKKQLFLAMPFL